MFKYTAVIDYYDKNKAQRVIRKTVNARNIKDAVKQLNALGKIINIYWEEVPNIAADRQLEMFTIN
ncbi:MAG: hypothetical protein ACOYVD_19330 [Bacillota bacterium]